MAKTNPEAPMIKQGKWKYTWHMMKTNKACYAMLLPFMSLFIIFTVVPVVMSLPMGFTNYNMIETPIFVCFFFFFLLFFFFFFFFLNAFLKTFFTFVFYAPSMTTSVYVTWQLILSGDSYVYLNSVLIDLGILNEPAQWLTDTNYILTVVIIVQLWMSMGAGFLAIRAGFQNIDKSMYEAGAIEGIKNRWQELFYITIPSMGPQLLFAAVIQISASITVGVVGQILVCLPSTDYAAHTIMNHATDYGNIRYEMGYASAICFVLFAAMLLANKGINWLLGKYLD